MKAFTGEFFSFILCHFIGQFPVTDEISCVGLVWASPLAWLCPARDFL